MFPATCSYCGEYIEHICQACTGRIGCNMRKTAKEKFEVCGISAIICSNKRCRKVLSIRKGEKMKKFFLTLQPWPDGSETWICCDAETGDQIPETESVKTEEEAREVAKEKGYTYELNDKEMDELFEKMEALGKW